MNLTLNALPDDFTLHANGDLERSAGITYPEAYFLVDTEGNFLVDTEGNFLIGYFKETVYPQILNALPDDFRLNTE